MRTFHKRQRQNRKFYFINNKINATNLRVLKEDGKQVGIVSKEEALKLAREKQVDLVLIAPKANPPVAKLINFKKFLYQEEKKLKEAKKGVKKSVVKDINLSLFIASADLERLKNKGQEFLTQGHQLRINLTLKGRENSKKDMAFNLIKNFIAKLGEVNIAKEPRVEGNVIRAVVSKRK